MKTKDLTGAALDWAVAECEMMRDDYRDRGLLVHRIGYGQAMPPYSTNWAQGGPIIEREQIKIGAWRNDPPKNRWQAEIHNDDGDWILLGPTPLIAAMRAYVASKLGDEVDVPEGL